MFDYEYAILDCFETEGDDCKRCEYLSQCRCGSRVCKYDEAEEHFNPNLPPLNASGRIWN